MNTINTYVQSQNSFFSPISLSQILTTSSKIDIVFPTTQVQEIAFPFGILAEIPITPIESNPDLTKPRIPGLARERVLRVDPSFDAPLEFGS
jgi:hypothetical protein